MFMRRSDDVLRHVLRAIREETVRQFKPTKTCKDHVYEVYQMIYLFQRSSFDYGAFVVADSKTECVGWGDDYKN